MKLVKLMVFDENLGKNSQKKKKQIFFEKNRNSDFSVLDIKILF